MQEDSNKIILKFKAVREKLDWQGNVTEDVQEKDYEWHGYNLEAFLDSVIKKGDYSLVPAPTEHTIEDHPASLFKQLFLDKDTPEWYNAWKEIRKYKTIETCPIDENGAKFVIWSRRDSANGKQMFWTSGEDDNDER